MKINRCITLPVVLIITFCTTIIASCDKYNDNNNSGDGAELISFTGLIAEYDTISVGQMIEISAVYEGTGLSFSWVASAGDILGGGHKVNYVASFCAVGGNTVSCTISTDKESITRSITIYVE